MSRIKVESEVNVYEEAGSEKYMPGMLKVRSHWNRSEFVVLAIGKTEITVAARDLEAAIKNARNSGGI